MKSLRALEVLLASGISTLGLLVATEGDYSIFKLLIFSRATVAATRLFGEVTGLFTPIKEQGEKRRFTVESFIALVSCVFLVYCYVFQVKAMSQSLLNMVSNGAGLTDDELRFFDAIRAVKEIERRNLKFD